MKVRELLDAPEKWTQRAMARDKRGNNCSSISNRAVCWCLVGAVIICYPGVDADVLWTRIEKAVISKGYETVSQWNDDPARTFEEVKELVERLDI